MPPRYPNPRIHFFPCPIIPVPVPKIKVNNPQAGILKSNKAMIDNANPRGTVVNAKIQKAIPADVYARWERAESAHKNLLENSPLFIGAVIVGNFAGLDTCKPRSSNLELRKHLFQERRGVQRKNNANARC